MSDELNQLTNTDTGNQVLLTDQSQVIDLFFINHWKKKIILFFFLKNGSRDLAVCVEGAWKNYGHWWKSMTALRDVTLHVPTGVM